MSTQVEAVMTPEYAVEALTCSRGCGKNATVYAKGCADKEPVALCEPCLARGLDVIRKYVQMYQRLNKRIMVCGDCYRPILTLETHLEIRRHEGHFHQP